MENYKYKAFISYSHTDGKWARWLHRRLETYPIPKNLIGHVTSAGEIPNRLKPIFRDQEELSASNNLGAKIETALNTSQNLIVICSPAAAKSKWVNQEILTFKRNNRDAQLFSVIVEGKPYASTIAGREDEECFPPALRYEVNSDGTLSDIPAEPLAADLRLSVDGKRLGVLKLISGMIGVGMDEVVQRDMRRGRKRVMAVTSASLAAVLTMGTLTGFAMDARQEAEQRRNDAEENIEFMITDLKDELEKVGRLPALKVVGQRAEAYYDKYPISSHNDEALGRRARVFHYLGEIHDKLGDLDTANDYFQSAYQATALLLSRDPNNTQRIYEHSQSAFWAGYVPFRKNDLPETKRMFIEYNAHANRLIDLDPHNSKFHNELISSYVNLGSFYGKQGLYNEALDSYNQALLRYDNLFESPTVEVSYKRNYTDTLGWVARTLTSLNRYEEAKLFRRKEISSACGLLGIDEITPWESIQGTVIQDWQSLFILASSQRNLAILEYYQGNFTKAVIEIKRAEKLFEKLIERDSTNKEWTEGYAYNQAFKVHFLLKSNFTSEAYIARENLNITLSQFETLKDVTELDLIKSIEL